MYFIINENGRRLCRDRRWRSFTLFGTSSSAPKTYKQKASAVKAANRVGGQVAHITSDESVERYVEASGLVIEKRPVPGKPGYETVTHASLSDFIV